MRALHDDGFGGLDQLVAGELPDPHIGPDTLLVKVVTRRRQSRLFSK